MQKRHLDLSAAAADMLARIYGVAGEVVVVVGAAYGHGEAAARLFAGVGAMVIGLDSAAEALDKLTAQVCGEGLAMTAKVLDPTDEAQVVAAFAGIAAEHGAIGVLVNAATLSFCLPFTEITGEHWDRVMNINAKATFLASREAVKAMKGTGGGRIINITTIGALHPVLHGNQAYSAAKAAATMLTRNIALDYAKDGITVNAVLPGAVLVPETSDPIMATRKPTGPGTAGPARHLSGSFTADKVAPLILFLAGEAASMITGQAIAVDGGFLVS